MDTLKFNEEEEKDAAETERELELKPMPQRTRPSRTNRRTFNSNFLCRDPNNKLYRKDDICWLSKAWRKKNNGHYPTLKEIMDGVVLEAVKSITD